LDFVRVLEFQSDYGVVAAVIFLIMGNRTVAVPLVSVGLVILLVSYGAATYITHTDHKD